MTLPQRSLHPASGNDRGALLGALELVARSDVQLGKIARAVVGQGVSLEPRPQVLHWIEIGRVRRQERNLEVPSQTVQIVAHEAAAMRPQTIPDDQQRLLQVGLECLEEIDDLLF